MGAKDLMVLLIRTSPLLGQIPTLGPQLILVSSHSIPKVLTARVGTSLKWRVHSLVHIRNLIFLPTRPASSCSPGQHLPAHQVDGIFLPTRPPSPYPPGHHLPTHQATILLPTRPPGQNLPTHQSTILSLGLISTHCPWSESHHVPPSLHAEPLKNQSLICPLFSGVFSLLS